MTLSPLIGTQRPFQPGRAIGNQNGYPHAEPVDWLVDTGADLSALLPIVANSFTTTAVPANTAPPGGTAYRLASGVEVELTVHTPGGPATVVAPTPMIVIKARNHGSNLIGMPQIAAVGAEVRWNPSKLSGELRQ